MPPPKREPLWVASFIAALGVCGNVTRSAALAGVDVTGPYNRRARYPEFRSAWERVMAEREARASFDTGSAIPTRDERPPSTMLRTGFDTGSSFDTGSAIPTQDERGWGEGEQAHPSLACGESSQFGRRSVPQTDPKTPELPLAGGELVCVGAAGVRLGRVAASRWSKGAEERFLEELTASANVARAAATAGFSAVTVYKRKLRDRHFSEGWDAAVAVGRARLEAHLLVAADRAFDPETLPIAEGAPKVTVGEAISILKHKPAGSAAGADDHGASQEEVDEAAQRILMRLRRLRDQLDQEKIAAGYTKVGEDWIPPGWGLLPVGEGTQP